MLPAHAATNRCRHKNGALDGRVAIVTLGNALRGDDGVSEAVCDALPTAISDHVCRFDLGCYTGHLASCLNGHRAAIIIDSVQTGAPTGSACVLNLRNLIDQEAPLDISSGHCLSLFDELRLSDRIKRLPEIIYLFGIEVSQIEPADRLSSQLETRLPELVDDLCMLIAKIMERTQNTTTGFSQHTG